VAKIGRKNMAINNNSGYEKATHLQEKIKDLEKALKLEKERSKNERKNTVAKKVEISRENFESKSQTLNRLMNEDEQYEKLKNNEIEAKTEAADLRYRLDLLRRKNDKLKEKNAKLMNDNTDLDILKRENERLKDKNVQLLDDNNRLYNLHQTDENEKTKLKEELKILVDQYKEDKAKFSKENDLLKREYQNMSKRAKVAEGYVKNGPKKKSQLLSEMNSDCTMICQQRQNARGNESFAAIRSFSTEIISMAAQNNQSAMENNCDDRDSDSVIHID